MAENTKIQWATHSWSPWRGCAKVSPGCTNCYAEKLSHRNPAVLGEWGVGAKRIINADWTKPLAWDRKAAKLGERHRVFPSLCDPFEDREDLDETRARFLELIEATPNLDWLLLTKRPESWREEMLRIYYGRVRRAHNIAGSWLDGVPLKNVWLGVSVENQEYAGKRLPILCEIPSVVPWVSYEPALGPVDFTPYLDFIKWIVVGGESGPGARLFNPNWARSVRDQALCSIHRTAVYVKQMGSLCLWEDGERFGRIKTVDPKGGDPSEWPADLRVREFPDVAGTLAREGGR